MSKGELRICPQCDGTGGVPTAYDRHYNEEHIRAIVHGEQPAGPPAYGPCVICPTCNGSGQKWFDG